MEVKNLIYASSSSVYGNSTEFPLKETQNILAPRSYYGATKLANEILAKSLSQRKGFSVIGLRFFTVYGPYGRPDMAYFRLIAQALNNFDFKLFGDGTIRRDFTYVDDTVTAIRLIAEKQFRESYEGSSILNIGGGKPVSIEEMIADIERQTEKKLDFQRFSTHSGDVQTTDADTEELKKQIDFVPEITLTEGISRTVEWAKRKHVIKNLSQWAESVN